MFWKLNILCFSLFAVVIGGSINNSINNSDKIQENTLYELPCLSFGGLCVHIDDCPTENRAYVKGLCPLQQDMGVECCHSLPKSETKCRKRGGECFSKDTNCPDALLFSRATDCSIGEKCCILVH